MTFSSIILSAAKVVKISGPILLAICIHETGLKNIKVLHDGNSASYGICQIKLATAKMLGYRGNGQGLMNPKINAKYAALYLKYQFNRYNNWCMAVAAFNAGRYNPSKKEPGHPRNIKYVINIRKKLNKKLKRKLFCNIKNGKKNAHKQ